MNTRENLLSQFALTHVESDILGQKVWVKQLTAAQAEDYQFRRINIESGSVDYAKVRGARAELVAMCLCDEDGTLLFKTAKEVGDSFPSSFVEAAYAACSEVNGMGGKDDLEDARKN